MEREGDITLLKPEVSPGSCRRRVVLFPAPLQGHISPMLQLANILYTRGFSITIVHTHLNSPNQSNYPHFTFQPIADDSVEIMKAISSAGVDNLLLRVILINRYCADSFRDCLARLLSENENEPIACLITDALWHFTQSVADGLSLPRIVLRTGCLSSFLVFAALPLLREKGYFNLLHQDYQSEKRLQEFPILKVKDLSKIAFSFIPEPEPIWELIANMVKQAKAASGIIWNSFKELEEPELSSILQDFPKPEFPIGPFHKYFPATSSSLLEQDWGSISWLDLQAPKSVLYVSFGSISNLNETDFSEMAWGLANSKQPFLWVVRPGSVHGSEWLGPLPNGFLEAVHKRGHIVKWAPQHKVLAHSATGGFWTHCGWNSTLESICEGVPMICSPFLGDQPVNARYVSGIWKVGVHLENGLERAEIESAIKRLMVDKEGDDMRERMSHLQEKVNLCVKKGGSSYESLESLVDLISSF